MEGTSDLLIPPARIYVLMAVESKTAAVLRHGPNGHWQMWLWDMSEDRFTPGQWFKGKVHVDSSDISPDGSYVALRLSKRGDDYHTVISRPPYFTALAYFPTHSYGGHSKFLSSKSVVVRVEMDKDDNRVLGGCPLKILDGMEDWPEEADEIGEGWSTEWYRPEFIQKRWGLRGSRPKDQSGEVARWSDVDLDRRSVVQLRRKQVGEFELVVENRLAKNNMVERFFLVHGAEVYALLGATWADFDKRRRCLLARGGRIVQLSAGEKEIHEKVLVDLNDVKFKEVAAPAWALRWKRR